MVRPLDELLAKRRWMESAPGSLYAHSCTCQMPALRLPVTPRSPPQKAIYSQL